MALIASTLYVILAVVMTSSKIRTRKAQLPASYFSRTVRNTRPKPNSLNDGHGTDWKYLIAIFIIVSYK